MAPCPTALAIHVTTTSSWLSSTISRPPQSTTATIVRRSGVTATPLSSIPPEVSPADGRACAPAHRPPAEGVQPDPPQPPIVNSIMSRRGNRGNRGDHADRLHIDSTQHAEGRFPNVPPPRRQHVASTGI